MSAERTESEIDVGAREPVELEVGPARVSSVASLFAALFAALLTAPFSGFALLFGLFGVVFYITGLFVTGTRNWVSLGTMSILFGILIVGSTGVATPPMLLASMVGLLVAWDTGEHAITIGEQFGRTAPTRRGEFVHVGGSLIVGVLTAGFVYLVYTLGTGGQPALAGISLLLGAVLLVWAMSD